MPAPHSNDALHLGSISDVRMASGPVLGTVHSLPRVLTPTQEAGGIPIVVPERVAQGPKADASPYFVLLYQMTNVTYSESVPSLRP